MNQHRYTLEPYQSGKPTRFDCPQCAPTHRRTFSRYIDTETGEHLADHIGRCSRESNCAYHYTPKQHYEDIRTDTPDTVEVRTRSRPAYRPKTKQVDTSAIATATIPVALLKASRKEYARNSFVKYLLTFTNADTVNGLISRYHIGTSKRWEGATVFWWVTPDGAVTGGQVVQFGADGHTAKHTYRNKEGKEVTGRRTRPIHKILLRQYSERKLTPPDWLTNYDQHGEKFPTLFGLHQLRTEPPTKPIAIVEAPATAIVASIYFPQFIWLAAGSLSWLTEKRLASLSGRTVCLFPDLGGFEKWQQKAHELGHLARFTVSDFLERHATDEQRKQGLDLRDFLTKFDARTFQQTPAKTSSTHVPPPDQTPVKTAIPETVVEVLDIINEPKPSLAEGNQIPVTARPDGWDVADLETFFASITLPTGPVELSQCETITDVSTFVESHLQYIRANTDKRAYLPYLARLRRFKTKLNIL